MHNNITRNNKWRYNLWMSWFSKTLRIGRRPTAPCQFYFQNKSGKISSHFIPSVWARSEFSLSFVTLVLSVQAMPCLAIENDNCQQVLCVSYKTISMKNTWIYVTVTQVNAHLRYMQTRFVKILERYYFLHPAIQRNVTTATHTVSMKENVVYCFSTCVQNISSNPLSLFLKYSIFRLCL